MLRELTFALLAGLASPSLAQTPTVAPRPRIGVAFGGGSARGLAHVGVIRWFEQHHIPIDLVSGTSMGGLIGGAYASGMSSAELTRLLTATDWDAMFGSSPFRYKSVRRKQDARAYPSRLEFGFRNGGVVSPPALNNGQQVEFLLARIAGAYVSLRSFDELPTPFRCVAVDLVSARPIVLDHGWLADAMRATMSLPGVFPPVDLEGHVLVDGGSMNNVPADVVRKMGADVVIAVPVGDISDTRAVDYSLYALAGETVDAMMRATTRIAMRGADIVINPARGFGSLDWRRNDSLAADGYAAAEGVKDKLLPLALDDERWAVYQAQRTARRRRIAVPAFVTITGATTATRPRMERALRGFVGRPLDVAALEETLEGFAGLDRYETVGWRLVESDGRLGLEVRARPTRYAPPFFMSGISLANTATDLFTFQLAARYLAFDVAGPESELRIDVAVGARPNLGVALHRPVGSTPLFVAPAFLAARRTLAIVQSGDIVAAYEERHAGIGLDVGVDLGRDDELRVGGAVDHLTTLLRVGDPQLPELRGFETRARLRWLHDGQDSPVVPSEGARAAGTIDHIFTSPEIAETFPTTRTNHGLTRAELTSSIFWSVGKRDRLFLVAGAGTSFDGEPLLTEQFELGHPLHLGAYGIGELHGSHYAVASVGYLWRVGRLPDFLGGPTFAGTWLENGSAFDELESARLRTDVSVGAIANTLVGPAIIGASIAVDGRWRSYLGIGRLF